MGLANYKVVDNYNTVNKMNLDTSKNVTIKVGNGTEQNMSVGTGENEYVINGAGDDEKGLTFYLGDSTEKQEITYYTTYKALDANNQVTNKVQMYSGDGPIGKTYEIGVETGSSYIAKSGVYNRSTNHIAWTVDLMNLTLFQGGTNCKFEDTFDTNIKQKLIDGTLKLLVKYTDTSNETKEADILSDGHGKMMLYDTQIGSYALTDGGTDKYDKEFSMNLGGLKSKLADCQRFTDIKLTYDTALDKDDNEIQKWLDKSVTTNNQIKVYDGCYPNGYQTIKATPTCETPVLKKETTTYDYENHTAGYRITVNEFQMAIDQPVVTDTLKNKKWAYDKASLNIMQNGMMVSSSKYSVDYFQNADGYPTMTINLPKMVDASDPAGASKPYIITYNAMITDTTILDTNDTVSMNNVCELFVLPGEGKAIKDATVNINGGDLKKTGQKSDSFTADHLLKWKIIVNRNNGMIKATGDKVTVLDKLVPGLSLVKNSIKINKLSVQGTKDGTFDKEQVGAALTNGVDYSYEYDEGSRVFKIVFEDDTPGKPGSINKAYQITYDTRTIVEGTYTNKAYLNELDSPEDSYSESSNHQAYYGGGQTFLANLAASGTGAVLIDKRNSHGDILAGAEFNIYTKTQYEAHNLSSPVATLMTNGTNNSFTNNGTTYTYNASIAGLELGDYVLVEKTAPTGYVKDDTPKNLSLAAGDLSRTVAEDTTMPTITKSADSKVITWTSGENALVLKYLPEGEYTLEETEIPDGYTYEGTMKFKIENQKVYIANQDGYYGAVEAGSQVLKKDKAIDGVYISKMAVGGNEEISGVHMKLTDKDSGALIDEWSSTNTAYKIAGNKLAVNHSYVLSEITAPVGYKVTEPVNFRLTKQGVVKLTSDNTNVDVTVGSYAGAVNDNYIMLRDKAIHQSQSNDISQDDIPQNDIPQNNDSKENVSQNNTSQNNVSQDNAEQTSVSKKATTQNDLSETDKAKDTQSPKRASKSKKYSTNKLNEKKGPKTEDSAEPTKWLFIAVCSGFGSIYFGLRARKKRSK